jgi:hypothetical protein
MSEANAVLALKNAWSGAVAASAEVEQLAAAVAAIPDATPVETLDLAAYRKVALGQSNAVLALQGVIEELQRKLETGKQI